MKMSTCTTAIIGPLHFDKEITLLHENIERSEIYRLTSGCAKLLSCYNEYNIIREIFQQCLPLFHIGPFL